MSETVTAANGVELPLIALAQTYAFSGGFIHTITVQYRSANAPFPLINYVQTFTNDGTQITAISQWVNAS